MTTDQIGNGYFPKGHPRWPGMEWWGLSHLDHDKRHRLGLQNSNVGEVEEDFGRFPVLSDGKKRDTSRDIGGTIKKE